MPADQQALADRLEDQIARSTGLEVTVHAAAGDRYALMVCGTEAVRRPAGLLGVEDYV